MNKPRTTSTARSASRVIVDECVGENSPLWAAFFGWFGARPVDIVHLRQKHQGIPDSAILTRLLEPGDVLITMDRILHNRACAGGFSSFTLSPSGHMTRKPLGGLPFQREPASRPVPTLKDDYIHTPSPLTAALRSGMTERELKGYRTRRRRIRAAFEGKDNITQLSLTISSVNMATGTLCGFYLQLAGRGRNGLDASEGYALDLHGALSPSLSPMRALMEIYLLDLEDVHTNAYFTSNESYDLCLRLRAAEFTPHPGSIEHALQLLLLGIERLTMHPCRKGRFVDRMTRQFKRLARSASSEVKLVDFVVVSRRICCGREHAVQLP
ncbi:MAG TPA: hypothetical protein VIV60_32840 [Polyangiaceae bacterium]